MIGEMIRDRFISFALGIGGVVTTGQLMAGTPQVVSTSSAWA